MDTVTIMVDALKALKQALAFELYPNPNKGSFTLALNDLSDKRVDLLLYDAFGRVIYKENLAKMKRGIQHKINLEWLSTGTYLLRITDGGKIGVIP